MRGLAIIEGGEQPRKDGQSDKERIKQLRVQKRIIDNGEER